MVLQCNPKLHWNRKAVICVQVVELLPCYHGEGEAHPLPRSRAIGALMGLLRPSPPLEVV